MNKIHQFFVQIPIIVYFFSQLDRNMSYDIVSFLSISHILHSFCFLLILCRQQRCHFFTNIYEQWKFRTHSNMEFLQVNSIVHVPKREWNSIDYIHWCRLVSILQCLLVMCYTFYAILSPRSSCLFENTLPFYI